MMQWRVRFFSGRAFPGSDFFSAAVLAVLLRAALFCLPVVLPIVAVLAGTVAVADAVAAEPDSGHSLAKGEPFFLLTDTSYGSDEEAKVRVEVPPHSFSVYEYGGGVDMLVYRITDPMTFLQQQKNLHRVQTDGNYVGEGMSNTLSYLWDSWYKRSRRMWQSLFSKEARQAVVKTAPELRTPRAQYQQTDFRPQPQYEPLAKEKGFELVHRFRYPIFQAQSIKPLEGVQLDGSSSDFIPAQEGNVYVPVGKLAPGLYLVEGIVGQHRASTLLFVSDTVGVTKLSSEQMLLWAANRSSSASVPDVKVFWTDGVGVLKSGSTDAQGLVVFERSSPERTYVMGQDAQGGVFISENFYYDSEIYNSKMYAVTDRPLYRPGDAVNVSIWGRDFDDSSTSRALTDGDIALQVIDPNGVTVLTRQLKYSAKQGGQTQFTLPPGSTAGGYELRFGYTPVGGELADGNAGWYSAAFRVVEYVKPHFSVHVQLDREKGYRTGEAVKGVLQLRYPDGSPVKKAAVQLSLRAQQLTMVEGEVAYAGMFPIKLQTQELKTDSSGNAAFELPAAAKPSRYALTAFASDGAALRVRTTREILIERAASMYSVQAAKQFSQMGEDLPVRYALLPAQGVAAADGAPPAVLEWVRLEDQSRGEVAVGSTGKDGGSKTGGTVKLKLPNPGSYSLTLRDAEKNILGGTTHWVAGAGLQVVPGSMEIVTDRPKYRIGDTAEVLISFSEPVEDALLTLERDAVQHYTLASTAGSGAGGKWIQLERLSPTQLRGRIRIDKSFAPNITFSVAYSKGGQFVFENRGLVVEQPAVKLEISADKAVYAPGDTVQLTLRTTRDGKPVAAQVALGMVDEMVYVLQPEIAPRISDFFYHIRRNNVRTTSSLSFISYDMATGRLAGPPSRSSTPQRGVKVLERPRREEVDTAYWNGALQTGEDGSLTVTLRMPDSLTRWRITARAMQPDTGLVGQAAAYVRSSRDFYTKWTSPGWMREGDTPTITWAAFNQTGTAQKMQYRTSLDAEPQDITLHPGANTIAVRLPDANNTDADAYTTGQAFAHDKPLRVELLKGGKVVDVLEKYLDGLPAQWQFPASVTLAVPAGANSIAMPALPADARDIQVQLVSSVDGEFARIGQDLLDYPYGCVEQTASRLVPLSMAIPALQSVAVADPQQQRRYAHLRQRLQHSRLRLVYMAGTQGTFGWWGNQTENNVLMTAYAYYADWQAANVLNISLPAEHWQPMLTLFGGGDKSSDSGSGSGSGKSAAEAAPLTQRVLALWFARQMGVPTDNILKGLLAEWKNTYGVQAVYPEASGRKAVSSNSSDGGKREQPPGGSPFLVAPDTTAARAMALVLLDDLVWRSQSVSDMSLHGAAGITATTLADGGSPAAQALWLMHQHHTGAAAQPEDVRRVLQQLALQSATTFDRALALIWARQALGTDMGVAGAASPAPIPVSPWRSRPDAAVAGRYYWANTQQQPTQLAFNRPVPAGWSAVVTYQSAARVPTEKLPVTIDRSLYRLEAAAKAGEYSTIRVQPGDSLDTDALYLDSLYLSGNTSVRYALLEVPLPPGAEVEATTWGVALSGQAAKSDAQPMERARQVPMRAGYAVPFDSLSAEELKKGVKVRHLVRFAQKGRFGVPAARLYSMYQPHRMAVEQADPAGAAKGDSVSAGIYTID